MRPLPLAATATALALATGAYGQNFSYPDFTSTAGLSTVFEATAIGPVMRVHNEIPSTGGMNMGAVWFDSPVAVLNGFETTFEFSITGTGNGDGMAFVVQNDQLAGFNGMSGVNGIGRHASACGYGMFDTSPVGESLDNSLVIEIDHVRNDNQPTSNPILDPDGNHISIHTGSTDDNLQQESYSIGRAEDADLSVNLDDGFIHTLRVVYVPGTIDVFLDGLLVLSTPYNFTTGGTWIDSGSSVGGLNLIGGTSAYVGFTGGGAGSPKNHDIHSWSFISGSAIDTFCEPANANSTGVPVTLSASNSMGGAGWHLDAAGGPSNMAAYFLISSGNGFAASISDGILCLASPQGRYNPSAGGALNSLGLFDGSGNLMNIAGTGGPSGMGFDLPIALPNPPGGSITVGSTWHFQLWYRDTNPSPVTNFSNGITIVF